MDPTVDQIYKVTVTNNTKVYRDCNQDLTVVGGTWSFPPLPRFQTEERGFWMSKEQTQLTNIYAWVFIGVLVIIALNNIIHALRQAIHILRGDYTVCAHFEMHYCK